MLASFISRGLFRLYAVRSPRLRRLILGLVKKLEGGELYSDTLRLIFAKFHGIEVGKYSYGCFRPLSIRMGTRIGRYCSFAKGVCIYNTNHPLNFRSMHPFFYHPLYGYVTRDGLPRRTITIGNDVWVGQNALILASVNSIGDGAVIGAGAVVTKDVPDFAIVAGNPARILRYRFDEKTREAVKASRWWDRAVEELDISEFSRPLCDAVDVNGTREPEQ